MISDARTPHGRSAPLHRPLHQKPYLHAMIDRFLGWLAPRNPWLMLLPALALYLFLAATLTPHDALVRDEVRYWGFADNLLHGHFHFKEGDNFLWSGPGYPVVLMPFVALDAPLILPKLLNAVLYYIAMGLFFQLAGLYFSRKKAWLATLVMVAYYVPWVECFSDIMTESLTICLMIGTTYLFCRNMRQGRLDWRDMLAPGVLLMWLMLTKVLFGYVVLATLLLLGAGYLLRGREVKVGGSLRFFALGMAFCLPYLLYTYSLTGKVFYWGNSGGTQLYWMSSPYPDELGDWHVASLLEHPSLETNHRAFFASIQDLDPVAKDDAFKRKALENIRQHPAKFVKNWAMNVTRTLFSHPLSFLKPSLGVFKYVIPHAFLLVLGAFFAWPTIRRHRLWPTEMLVLLVFCGIYLAGTSLLASYARFFFPVVPILVLWLGYGLDRFVRVRFAASEGPEVGP